MRIIFYGNRQVGMIGLLATMALGHEIVQVWEDYGYGLPDLAQFDLQRRVIRDKLVVPQGQNDLLLCIHGRRIIPRYILNRFRLGGVNLHPFLEKYPGLNPVKRAILARETVATVYAHKMTDQVDSGEVLASATMEIPTQSGDYTPRRVDVYNELYSLYAEVVAMVLKKLGK